MDYRELTWIIFCTIWIICCFVPSEAYDDNLFSNSLILRRNSNETIQARMAAFGPRINEEGVNGVIIPMNGIDEKLRYGCSTIGMEEILDKVEEKYHDSIIENGFIAMVERGGGCSFSHKIRNMQDSGAKAVIVGNNNGEIRLITMYASDDTSDIQIPSVFILQYDMYVLQDSKFEEITIIEDYSDWSAMDAFVLIIVLPLAFMFGIFVIYKFRIDSFETELQNTSNVSLGAATQEEVDALPIKIFNMKLKKENDPETCAVCIDDFVDGDKLRVLPCHHEYHVECIDLWLTTRKRFCPICKRTIDGEDEEADENTPLLGRNNSNSYNTEDQNSSSSNLSNHIIDIDQELGESEEATEEEHEDHEDHEDHSTSQEGDSNEDSENNENEPLINSVTRS